MFDAPFSPFTYPMPSEIRPYSTTLLCAAATLHTSSPTAAAIAAAIAILLLIDVSLITLFINF